MYRNCSRVVATGGVGGSGSSGLGVPVSDGGHAGGEEALRGAQDLVRRAGLAQVTGVQAERAHLRPPALGPVGVHDPHAALAEEAFPKRLRAATSVQLLVTTGIGYGSGQRVWTYGAEDLDGHVLVEEAEDDAVILFAEEADLVHDGGVVHERLGGHVLALRFEQLAQRVQGLRARRRAARARARRAPGAAWRGEGQAGRGNRRGLARIDSDRLMVTELEPSSGAAKWLCTRSIR